jgi:Acetyltransferase (GNAT) family.
MLRDFQPADQPALRRLIFAGLQERWGQAFDAALNPDLDDFVGNYLDGGAEIILSEASFEIIATGMLVPEEGNAGRIIRMSVAATYRRQGSARRVVEELIRRARRRKMSEVRVLTDTPRASAVELYRACAFTEIGSDGTDTHFVMPL